MWCDVTGRCEVSCQEGMCVMSETCVVCDVRGRCVCVIPGTCVLCCQRKVFGVMLEEDV